MNYLQNGHKALLMFRLGMLLLHIAVLETAAQSVEQAYISKKFTTENGLSHDYVHWITQDKTGFLWIATWDGVSRFDGYEFRNYYHQPEEENSLPFFAVNKIVADSMNNVWSVSFNRPLSRYDRSRDRFVRDNFSKSKDSVIWDIEVSSRHSLDVLLEDGICQYNPASGVKKMLRFVFQDQLEKERFYGTYYQLARDNNGDYWMIGFCVPKGEFQIFKAVFGKDSCYQVASFGIFDPSPFQSARFSNEMLNANFHISSSGKIWLFCRFGIYSYDHQLCQFVHFRGIPDPGEFSGTGYYPWMEDATGLHLFDRTGQNHIQIPVNHGLNVTTAFLDQSRTIWSGDLNQYRNNIGLNRYTSVPRYFIHYLTEKDKTGNNRLIFPVCEGPDGEIWVGTRYADEVFRILKDGTVIPQSFYDRNIGQHHPRIRSMVKDSAGVWMGCTGNFLVRYDFASKRFRSIYIAAKTREGDDCDLALHNILQIKGGLLINGGEGIYHFDAYTGETSLVYQHFQRAGAFCFVQDGKGGYWIGYKANTIVHLDCNLLETGRYKPGREFNNVEHILPGDSSDIWIALMGGGLAHFFPKNGMLKFYTTSQGLINNTVYSLLKDKRQHIWVSTNAGISEFNPRIGVFRNFSRNEGLLIQEFNSDSWCQSSDGFLHFGGVGGMVRFHPDSLNQSEGTRKDTPLVITDFSVSGLPRYFEKAVYETDTIILHRNDNNCQVKFACLDLQNPEKIRYRYRLSGLNEQWTETDHRNRVVSFAGLTHRNYLFQVEASDYDGEWITRTSLVIIIPHFYYQTWWFRVLVLLIVSTFLGLLLFMVFRQIRLKARQKEGELRLESLRGQMNPHFIFNSLNSINYFISRNDKLMANQYIADFSRLIRSILQNHSSDYIPLEKEIESLNDYLKLEHLRFSDKFDYVMETQGIGDLKQIMVFPGMVQPFIENAVWHGVRGLEERLGMVIVRFLPGKGESLRCIVIDDGVGRKLSERFKSDLPGKKSRGIGIVMERLKVINSLRNTHFGITIEDAFPDNEETGTRVTIDIPMKQNE